MYPAVVDCANLAWPLKACETLKQNGYAILQLTAADDRLVDELYSCACDLFDNSAARRQLEVPQQNLGDLDRRTGYIEGPKREWYETHIYGDLPPRVHEASAVRLVRVAQDYELAMQKLALDTLQALVDTESSSHLASLLPPSTPATGCDTNKRTVDRRAAFSSSMLRVYRYNRMYNLPDGDPHIDMGLLTVIPRGSRPGLEIQPLGTNTWLPIEEVV